MKSFMRLSLLLVLSIVMFASCKKSTSKQTRFIPKDASFVLTINSKALQSKLNSNMATIESIFKNMSKDNDSALDKGKKEFEDFRNAGLDLDENLYLSFVTKGGSMMRGSGSQVITGVAGLKDASKFEAYIKKKDATAEVRKEKDYSYVTKNDNIVAWGKDVVLAMTIEQATAGMMEYDSANHTYNLKPGAANQTANLLTEMTAYFNMKDEETIAAIPEFKDLMGEKADASFWTNSSASIGQLSSALPKVKELTENSYTAGTINFEDGRVAFDSKTYTSRALADLMKKYTGATADLSLVQSYPSNNVNGFVVFSVNPELINGVVNYLEVEAMANNFLTRFLGPNFTLQDVLKAFKGEFALVVSDLAMNTNQATPMGGRPSGMPRAQVLFNALVGDKTQLNRILDNMVEKQMLMKENNQYVLPPMLRTMGFQLSVDDKNILISTDSSALTAYRNKTGKASIDNSVLNDFKDKSAVGYVDIQKTMNAFPVADTIGSKALNSAKATFKDARGYADNFNGKFIKGHYELRMMNDKENSLTSLLKFFGTMGETYQASQKRAMYSTPDVIVDTVYDEPKKGM